jgi:Aromatic-ring-opening dioxygenase LigAB, LigA subunit
MAIADTDRTLPSNRMVFEVRRDMSLVRRFQQNVEPFLEQYGLSAEEKQAWRDEDLRKLGELGVHPYFIPQVTRLFHGNGYNFNSSDAAKVYIDQLVPGSEDGGTNDG